MSLTHLFSPLKIPNIELKNRIVMLGTTLHYPPVDGSVDDRTFHFLLARAKGGAGLIVVGGIAVDEYAGVKGHLRLDSDAVLPSFVRLNEAMHQAGAKTAAQLFHAGRYALLEKLQPRAPSGVLASHYSHTPPKEMSKADIEETIEHFVQAARRAKATGFDAVEMMCSQGYLVNEFTSPIANQRTDEYGGSFENRLRFPLEMIQRVK